MLVHALRTTHDEPDDSRSFRLRGRLAEVSTGVTCLADAPPPDERRVCLRFARGHADDAVLQRFVCRQESLAELDHPGLVTTRWAGRDPVGRPYFVMDAVEGEDIESYCDRRRLDLGRRLALLIEACAALAHAHARDVVHGAIEPGDLIVADEAGSSTLRVLGTGLAGILGSSARDLDPDTIVYRSPEQVMGAASAEDPRSDVYALGVVAYAVLGGALPHDGTTLDRARKMGMLGWTYQDGPLSLIARASLLGERTAEVAARRGLSPERLVGAMHGDLDRVLRRALSPDPTARHADAQELGQDLESARIG